MSVRNADYLSLIGKSLSTAEYASLQSSLSLLSARHNGATAEFWGKVCGCKNDYLVVQMLAAATPLGPRVSFYSVDGGNDWTVLSELTEEQSALCNELRGLFQGDPRYAYRVRKDLPPVVDPQVELPERSAALQEAAAALGEDKDRGDATAAHSDADEEGEDEEGQQEEDEEQQEDGEALTPKKPQPQPKYVIVTIEETKRLAHFIAIHDTACRLAVRGQYILPSLDATPEPNTVAPAVCVAPAAIQSLTFAGQPLHNALKPSCYLRVSASAAEQRNAVLYGATYNPHTDFLRPITDDMPQGVWSVKYDAARNVVAVVNWLFEGALFWYRPDTLEQGQVYFGRGERNFDVLFML